jgi:hypothetical protein
MRAQAIFKDALQIMLITSTLAPAAALAQDEAQAPQKQTEVAQKKTEQGGKSATEPGGGALGMSILGNHEAPKALVLVPWKPSEPGKVPEISTKADDSKNPIDKEVFMRMLQYHQIAKTNARSKQ